MPIPDQYRDICQMLLEATQENRLQWTEERGVIAVKLPQFNFEIWSGTDEDNKEFVAVGLKDPKDNELVDNWYVEEGDNELEALRELWQSARRQARGVPEKLDALREFLRERADSSKSRKQP